MTTMEIAAAMKRVESVLQKRPEFAMHEDAPASARWDGGLKVSASSADGFRVGTDMPEELGGQGEGVTPGWLMRAGLASCAVTRIAMAAAAEGIALGALEVKATSRSDIRGLLAMTDGAGALVPAGPHKVCLQVRISAPGVSSEHLRLLVENSHRAAPVSCALERAIPITLQIDVDS